MPDRVGWRIDPAHTGIFLYELMFGFTPFRGAHRDQTFENVLHRAVIFPEEPAVSSAAEELVRALLIRDPTRRLGAVGGASPIMRHSFYAGVDFTLIRCQKPPFIPARAAEVAVPIEEEAIYTLVA